MMRRTKGQTTMLMSYSRFNNPAIGWLGNLEAEQQNTMNLTLDEGIRAKYIKNI